MKKATTLLRIALYGLYGALTWTVGLLPIWRRRDESGPRSHAEPVLQSVDQPRWLIAIRRQFPRLSSEFLWAVIPLTVVVLGTLVLSCIGIPTYRRMAETLSILRHANALRAVTPVETDALVNTDLILAVRLSGDRGLPLEDSVVSWRVVAGEGGVLASQRVRTNERGEALNTLRVPAEPGRLTVVALAVAANPPSVTFEIDVDSAGTGRLQTVRGDRQTGVSGYFLHEPLGVQVIDRGGKGVRSVVVRFEVLSGGGTVEPQVALTDSQGSASARWRLGPLTGRQEIAAWVPAAGDTVFTFVATAVEAAPPPTESSPEIAEEDVPAAAEPLAEGRVEGVPAPAAEVQPAAGEQLAAATAEPAEDSATAGVGVEEPTSSEESLAVIRRSHAVGGEHVCNLSGGTPSCRGANDRGQAGAGGTDGLVFIAAGLSHSCALDETGAAVCWGGNERGQLGDGTTSDRSEAGPVQADRRFAMLVAGVSHSCGLSVLGQVLCWGANMNGQLGDGTRDDRLQPASVQGAVEFRSVAAGWNHTCGTDAAGTAYCWGLNDEGELGDGSRQERLAPVRIPGSFSALTAGSAHTCGISGGRVLCWGDNASGQLGDGTRQDRSRAVAVPDLGEAVISVAAGALHTCALGESGAVYCWGQNLRGELGDGTTESRSSPTRVAGERAFRSLEAGGGITCAFSTDGSEYCWGQNRSGQLGDGSRTSRSLPTRVVFP
jgi:alpha-tubulin suppressor-like RCC1 family protein